MKISAKWKFRFGWSVLELFVLSNAWASTDSDVEVALVIEPGRIVTPDTEGVFHITATNHGPVTVEPLMVLAKQLDGAEFFLDIFPGADAAPCTFAAFVADGLPGIPSYKGYMLWPGSLAVGHSVTCRLKFRAGPEALGAVQLYASAYPGINDEYDPDESNSVILTRIIVRPFGAGPEPVPVPAVIPFWHAKTAVFLILVMMIAGALRYVRR